MIFQERKIETGYSYDVEDVFGTVHLESDVKLDGEKLDGVVVLLLRQNIRAEEIRGEVKFESGKIIYIFKRAPTWTDDDEDDICENTPTSTSEQVKGSTWTANPAIRTLSLLQRFVEAFREAWKKTK